MAGIALKGEKGVNWQMAKITQFLASFVKAEGRVVLNVIILLLLLVHHGCQEVLRCSDRHHEERGEDGDDLGNRILEIFQSAVKSTCRAEGNVSDLKKMM